MGIAGGDVVPLPGPDATLDQTWSASHLQPPTLPIYCRHASLKLYCRYSLDLRPLIPSEGNKTVCLALIER